MIKRQMLFKAKKRTGSCGESCFPSFHVFNEGAFSVAVERKHFYLLTNVFWVTIQSQSGVVKGQMLFRAKKKTGGCGEPYFPTCH